ncbi:hypothetical protein [Zooshikella harenae]|uniref:HEAT repeat domain-containing protein n=1 Tax=Zooshikella harenae TaxID=2827238 RepID=A0ABS5ZIV0_9GAMM|nr:hypothetical protein [Zooshikella harenae]MBU2713957.1 hypothetical protein [Zooshikella harenae]
MNQSNLGKFIQILSRNYSEELWSELVYENAMLLADSLAESDWNKLTKIWTIKNISWQRKFADVLSAVDSPSACTVLIDMLSSDNDEVLEEVVDSLHSILQSNIHKFSLTNSQREKLLSFLERCGRLYKPKVELLLNSPN